MNAVREMLESWSPLALTSIAFGLTCFVIGAGSLLVGIVWISCQFLYWLPQPTMLMFPAIFWVFFWPGLCAASAASHEDELMGVLVSFAGWFVLFAFGLHVGRLVVGK